VPAHSVDDRMKVEESNDSNNGSGGSDSENVVRIRGLPWQATREQVAAFFVGKLASLAFVWLIVKLIIGSWYGQVAK